MIDRASAAGQGHVLGWLEGMPAGARQRLLDRLAQVDFARVKQLAALIGEKESEYRAAMAGVTRWGAVADTTPIPNSDYLGNYLG